MWAYFLGSAMYKDRYGGSMPTYPQELWFRPEILGYIYQRGISITEIFRLLKPEVNSVESLRNALVSRFPDLADQINDTFDRYGR